MYNLVLFHVDVTKNALYIAFSMLNLMMVVLVNSIRKKICQEERDGDQEAIIDLQSIELTDS